MQNAQHSALLMRFGPYNNMFHLDSLYSKGFYRYVLPGVFERYRSGRTRERDAVVGHLIRAPYALLHGRYRAIVHVVWQPGGVLVRQARTALP